MDKTPQPRAEIFNIAPYVQGKSRISGKENPIKLSSNESSIGPSPKAIEAFKAAADSLHRYPDGSQQQLKQAIAEVHQLDSQKIICGNGSDELLDFISRLYLRPGDELLLSENHFIMCRIYGLIQGAKIVLAPEKEYTTDVDGLLEKVSDKTRVVVLANPNNPTGTYLPAREIQRLHEGLPKDTLLLLDEAYAEYVTVDDYETGLRLVTQHDNIVVTRTFSKIYALSALRIGWAYCPDAVIDLLQRMRSPFNTNAPALAAAAAAVRDTGYVAKVREHNALWREKIIKALTDIGLKVIPSMTNFYLISFEDCPGKSAFNAAEFLESQGIIPRAVSTGDSENILRITIGLEHENKAALEALAQYMGRTIKNQ